MTDARRPASDTFELSAEDPSRDELRGYAHRIKILREVRLSLAPRINGIIRLICGRARVGNARVVIRDYYCFLHASRYLDYAPDAYPIGPDDVHYF